jgi:hypothetical protein
MPYKFLNNARMTVASAPGTGDIVVDAPLTKFQSFTVAGLTDGDTAHFRAEEGNDWEIFLGTWDDAAESLSRVFVQSSTGSTISLTGAAEVEAVPTAESLELLLNANLQAEAELIAVADRISYYTGTGAKALATLTSFGRSILALADASAARTLWGLVIGTDVQAHHANLAAEAGLTGVADRVSYYTGAGAKALATFTSFGRTLLALADYAALKTGLGWDAALLVANSTSAPVSKTAAHTLVLGDAGDTIVYNSASDANMTLPNAILPAGTFVNFLQVGTGKMTFVAGSGATRNAYNSAYRSAGPHAMITAWTPNGTDWYVGGALIV